MQELRIHYKSTFNIRIIEDSKSWKHIASAVRKWIIYITSKKGGNSDLLISSTWYSGNTWNLESDSNIRIKTFCEKGQFDNQTPEFWTMRMEQTDSLNSFRVWRADIGLQRYDDGLFRFTIIVSNFMKPTYMGAEMFVNDLNVPGIIKTLAIRDGIECTIGDQVIPLTEIYLVEPGKAQELVTKIFSKDRVLPYILIYAHEDGEFYVNPSDASRLLLGNAQVVAVKLDAQAELNYFLKVAGNNSMYTCKPGYVRVYFQVHKDNLNDHKQHRFIVAEKSINTSNEVIQIIARSLIRRVLFNAPFAIVNEIDINNVIRERRLNELRNARSIENDQEYYKLLEDENLMLNQEIRKSREMLNMRLEEVYEFQYENEDLKKEILYLNNKVNFILHQSQEDIETVKTSQIREYKHELLRNFKRIPKSLYELLLLSKVFFNNSVIFLDSALNSAKEADYRDLDSAWDLLQHINNTLFPLFFHENPAISPITIAIQFENISGYELAFTEKKLTNNDSAIMKQREFYYNGRVISCIPHIKDVKQSKHLRVHFYVDRENEKIVIGHFGNHLMTAGTKRM